MCLGVQTALARARDGNGLTGCGTACLSLPTRVGVRAAAFNFIRLHYGNLLFIVYLSLLTMRLRGRWAVERTMVSCTIRLFISTWPWVGLVFLRNPKPFFLFRWSLTWGYMVTLKMMQIPTCSWRLLTLLPFLLSCCIGPFAASNGVLAGVLNRLLPCVHCPGLRLILVSEPLHRLLAPPNVNTYPAGAGPVPFPAFAPLGLICFFTGPSLLAFFRHFSCLSLTHLPCPRVNYYTFCASVPCAAYWPNPLAWAGPPTGINGLFVFNLFAALRSMPCSCFSTGQLVACPSKIDSDPLGPVSYLFLALLPLSIFSSVLFLLCRINWLCVCRLPPSLAALMGYYSCASSCFYLLSLSAVLCCLTFSALPVLFRLLFATFLHHHVNASP